MLNYVLPKRQVESILLLDDPKSADIVLSRGKLTINGKLALRISDCLGVKKTSYTAGTAQVVEVDLSSMVVEPNQMASVSFMPANLSGHDKQSNSFYFTVSVPSGNNPNDSDIVDSWVAEINKSTNFTGVTASNSSGKLILTSATPLMGVMHVRTNVAGAIISDSTPYVSPSGSKEEVLSYYPGYETAPIGTKYTTYLIKHRTYSRNQEVRGAIVSQESVSVIYANEDGATHAAFITAIDAVFAGTATASGYLGVPTMP